MYRHLLILPDGREVFSGPEQKNAIRQVRLVQTVNQGTELTLGSACSCELQAELFTDGSLSLSAGDRITLLQVDEEENRQQVGVFWLEKPEFPTAHTMSLTAYDSVNRLDRDLTQWLAALDQWPYTVRKMAGMVCDRCGLSLRQQTLPNGEFHIRRFAAEAVTGRHLIQWLGQITGTFCRACADGTLEFAWYTPNTQLSVAAEAGEGRVFYYQGELEYADYTVTPVEKVQLRQSASDVGTVWPDETGEKNTYIIENNPMLAAQTADTLQPVAQTLYERLREVSYTPCRVTVPAQPGIRPGDILSVTDAGGKTVSLWVMKKTSDGMRDTLEATGSHRRDNTTAVNDLGFRALSGKVLNLRTDVDGLEAENRDAQGRLAALALDLEGIRSRVERQEAQTQGVTGTVSTLTQTAESLRLELETVRESGTQKVRTDTGYTFDEKGLQISRSDSDMENLLDHTGMYVRRSGETVLQANNQGVLARDVTVGNYLILGENTRIEDYGGDRTACFYIG